MTGDPKATINRIKKAQELIRKVQEANQISSYDSNLEGDLDYFKNSEAEVYRAVNGVNTCVDRAIRKLNRMYKEEQKNPPTDPDRGTGTGTGTGNQTPQTAIEQKGRQDAKEKLDSKLEQNKSLVSLTKSNDEKKNAENIKAVENAIKQYDDFKNDKTANDEQNAHS